MKALLLFVAAILLASMAGCPDVAVRDTVVYKTEIKFMEQASVQSVDQVEMWVKAYCCKDNKVLPDERCRRGAKIVQVVRTRVPYHRDMMLYLGGVTDKRPPKEPPVVPSGDELCEGGN